MIMMSSIFSLRVGDFTVCSLPIVVEFQSMSGKFRSPPNNITEPIYREQIMLHNESIYTGHCRVACRLILWSGASLSYWPEMPLPLIRVTDLGWHAYTVCMVPEFTVVSCYKFSSAWPLQAFPQIWQGNLGVLGSVFRWQSLDNSMTNNCRYKLHDLQATFLDVTTTCCLIIELLT